MSLEELQQRLEEKGRFVEVQVKGVNSPLLVARYNPQDYVSRTINILPRESKSDFDIRSSMTFIPTGLEELLGKAQGLGAYLWGGLPDSDVFDVGLESSLCCELLSHFIILGVFATVKERRYEVFWKSENTDVRRRCEYKYIKHARY